MKRILVTGGSGFVGRHAIPALEARGFDFRRRNYVPLSYTPPEHRTPATAEAD